MKRFPWVFTVLWGGVFGLMITAGIWQLGRGEEKAQIMANQKQAGFKALVEPMDWLAAKHWHKVSFDGQWLDWTFLQDNQMMAGQLGHFVFSVVRAKSGQYVLINRGWIQTGTPTAVRQMNGSFAGQIAPWPKPGFQLGEQSLSDEVTQTVTYLDQSVVMPWLKARLCDHVSDCQIMPWVLKLDPNTPDGFQRDWALPRMTAEKHRAYAFQWFSMALVLLIVYGVFIRKQYAK